MSQSSHDRPRVILYDRDGELEEFARLLAGLALSVDVQTGDLLATSEMQDASLVVVPGRRLVETNTTNLAFWPPTIAVLDDASRTLTSFVNRLGLEMVIRRPIHPRTLRLLLLHQIYSGPERRARKRVLVGHPIRVGNRVFKSAGTLLELSKTGARVELRNAPEVGHPISIVLGKELTRGKPLRLEGRVVRCIRPACAKKRVPSEVGIQLLGARKHAPTIQALLDRFALGPARLKSGRSRATPIPRATHTPRAPIDGEPQPHTPASFTPTAPTEPAQPDAAQTPAPEQPGPPRTTADESTHPSNEIDMEHAAQSEADVGIEQALQPRTEAASETALDANADGEAFDRRRDARVPYEERIVALGEEASRVLMGRDLSHGGMRVETTTNLQIGTRLRLALHGGTVSLVVMAEVQRDDGDDGIVLRFRDLSPAQHETLDRILLDGGAYETEPDDELDFEEACRPIVVGELLDEPSLEPAR